MTTPALSGRAEIGKWYLVPCIKVDASALTIWMDVNGWVPVLGPKHRDIEHLEFDFEHWHIDWRFVGHRAYKYAAGKISGSPLSRVLTNDGAGEYRTLNRSPELRRIKCKRDMPTFPQVRKFATPDPWVRLSSGVKWPRLERAQAITCNKLKPGNICPHRGIDLTPFVKPDGTVTCPGHGLRWDTNTGDLLPYQESAW